LPCSIKAINSSADYDCCLAIEDVGLPASIQSYVNESAKHDKAFTKSVQAFICDNKLTIYSPLNSDDYSDVRDYFNAAKSGMERIFKAGCTNPLLILPSVPKFKNAEVSSVLGALAAAYVPIQYREDVPDKAHRIKTLFLQWSQKDQLELLIEKATMLESGLYISRDIGGGDPERMSPPNVAKYVEQAFTSNVIKVEIISDQNRIEKEFPLFAAVNRAARVVPRHQGRIVLLEYKPPKPSRKTLMLVGKGVTYDTGGADVKAGGIMAGKQCQKNTVVRKYYFFANFSSTW
jgi:leucyl aminopeptidase